MATTAISLLVVTTVPGLLLTIGQIQTSIVATNGRVLVNETSIIKIKIDILDLKIRDDEFSSQIEDLSGNIDTLKTNVFDINTEISTLQSKTLFLSSESEFSNITYVKNSSFEIYDNSNVKIFDIDIYQNYTKIGTPIQISYNDFQYFYCGSDGALFENCSFLTIKVPTFLDGNFYQKNGFCQLVQNEINGTGLLIENKNDENIKQKIKANPKGIFNDATVSVSPNIFSNFPTYSGSENAGNYIIEASVITLLATQINLGDSSCQINIAGLDFTKYFTQIERKNK